MSDNITPTEREVEDRKAQTLERLHNNNKELVETIRDGICIFNNTYEIAAVEAYRLGDDTQLGAIVRAAMQKAIDAEVKRSVDHFYDDYGNLRAIDAGNRARESLEVA